MAFYDLPDFSYLTNLKSLILEDNDFDAVTIEKLPPNLEYLNLSNNPIDLLEILEFPKSFKTLTIQNVKLREQPVFVDYPEINIKYSYNQNCLKKCEICLNQIYTLQPYYNKKNDGYFLCEHCHDENIQSPYERKINKISNKYYCDNIDCKKRITKHIF